MFLVRIFVEMPSCRSAIQRLITAASYQTKMYISIISKTKQIRSIFKQIDALFVVFNLFFLSLAVREYYFRASLS